jgi:hypothetical protein
LGAFGFGWEEQTGAAFAVGALTPVVFDYLNIELVVHRHLISWSRADFI